MKKILWIGFLFFIKSVLMAQPTNLPAPTVTVKKEHLVQFSGLLLTDAGGNLVPVPYATVFIPSQSRGTYADYKGFFTIVAQPGEKIRFSSIGFSTVNITLSDTLTQDRYSVVQLMTQDTTNLPEIVIMPWPSKEHFKLEFLKMDVTPELQYKAAENLANEYMAEARKGDKIVPYSAKESANFYLRQKSREYVYIGQTPPMNIFSPLAWGQFFKAWKNGDFKKKKKGE